MWKTESRSKASGDVPGIGRHTGSEVREFQDVVLIWFEKKKRRAKTGEICKEANPFPHLVF